MGDLGSISGLGRFPGEGKGYPLQYSGLENSMDCTVHGVAKSQTRLSNFHFHCTPMDCVAHQASLSTGFFRQEYWSGLPFPPSGDPPYPGMESMSPALAGKFFTTAPPNQVSQLRQVPQKHTAGPSPQVPFTPAYLPSSLVRLIHRGSVSP